MGNYYFLLPSINAGNYSGHGRALLTLVTIMILSTFLTISDINDDIDVFFVSDISKIMTFRYHPVMPEKTMGTLGQPEGE